MFYPDKSSRIRLTTVKAVVTGKLRRRISAGSVVIGLIDHCDSGSKIDEVV